MKEQIFLIIFAVVNTAAFLLCGFDKLFAIRKKRRISEKHLILWAFLFGACGMLLSMLLFSHKTRKPKFMITVPLFAILQIVAFFRII